MIRHTQSDYVLTAFSGPMDAAEYVDAMPAAYKNSSQSASFYGAPMRDVRNLLLTGSQALASKTIAIFDQVQKLMPATAGVPMLASSVAGYMPSVPAFMAGHPMTMLATERSEAAQSTRSPVRVVASLTVSQSVTQAQLIERGAAIAALVLALRAVRPVELIAVAALAPDGAKPENQLITFALDTETLDLTTLAYFLASPDVSRRLCLNIASREGGLPDKSWSCGFAFNNNVAKLRNALGMEPRDVLIPSSYTATGLPRTIQWVNDQVEAINARTEA